jgi:hypothetical protein
MPFIEAADRTVGSLADPDCDLPFSSLRPPPPPQRNRTRRKSDTQFVTTPGPRRRNTIDNAL